MTKLELTIGENKVSWENPSEDLTVEDIVVAFYGLLVTHTYSPDCVIAGMEDFVDSLT